MSAHGTLPDVMKARLAKAQDARHTAAHHVQHLLASANELLGAYLLERGAFYESVTTSTGKFLDPDDKRAVKEMDAIIARANRALAQSRAALLAPPDA